MQKIPRSSTTKPTRVSTASYILKKCNYSSVILKIKWSTKQNSIKAPKLHLHVQNMVSFKQQAKQQRAGVRGRRGEDWRKRGEEEEEEEERGGGKNREREKADVLEPEKCPLPREVGPFFPLLTGGENIYKTNRVHITSERHWHRRQQDTSLQKQSLQLHMKSFIPKRQGNIWLEKEINKVSPDSHHITISVGNVRNFTFTLCSLFLS